MKKKTITLILNLAKFIFTDKEYNKLLSYVKLNLLNSIRIFVEEKLEFLEATLVLYKNDTVIEAQLKKCRELDTVITEEYMNSLVTSND